MLHNAGPYKDILKRRGSVQVLTAIRWMCYCLEPQSSDTLLSLKGYKGSRVSNSLECTQASLSLCCFIKCYFRECKVFSEEGIAGQVSLGTFNL